MQKTNIVLVFCAFVMPFLVQAVYLPLTESLHHRHDSDLWQIDLAVFLASLVSGAACVFYLNRSQDISMRIVLALLYVFVFGYLVNGLHGTLCFLFHWRFRGIIT